MSPSEDKTGRPSLERHVVLVAPDIHWNTGNIGRTCLATGASLHLVEPLGFSLQSRELKRAGLDYWHQVKPEVWNTFETLLRKMSIQRKEIALFSKRGRRSFRCLPAAKRLFLVFGSETRGLPEEILKAYRDRSYHIPIKADIRSLNLSTAAGIALYESLRGTPPFHGYSPF
jgi:tRNA (cytidine/uridine-2'-O-)-methyltransferase